MLILTRRAGEAIRIGADITVVITSVKGNQVRIGTEAPQRVAVHREEIFERLQHEANAGRDESRFRSRHTHARSSPSSAMGMRVGTRSRARQATE